MGALEDLASHSRIRLIPFFANSELATIDERDVREWLAVMYEDVGAGELSAKTVNNARTWLAVVFNEAVRRRLMPATPARRCRGSRTWPPSSTTYASRRSTTTSTGARRTTAPSRNSSSARALGSRRRSR